MKVGSSSKEYCSENFAKVEGENNFCHSSNPLLQHSGRFCSWLVALRNAAQPFLKV